MSCLLADDNTLSPFSSEMIFTSVHMNAIEANPHLQNPKRKKRKKEGEQE
jgi:hypothetical protein